MRNPDAGSLRRHAFHAAWALATAKAQRLLQRAAGIEPGGQGWRLGSASGAKTERRNATEAGSGDAWDAVQSRTTRVDQAWDLLPCRLGGRVFLARDRALGPAQRVEGARLVCLQRRRRDHRQSHTRRVR